MSQIINESCIRAQVAMSGTGSDHRWRHKAERNRLDERCAVVFGSEAARSLFCRSKVADTLSKLSRSEVTLTS